MTSTEAAATDQGTPMSTRYAAHEWRAGVARRPRWAAITTAEPCDECAMIQHETAGAYGFRRQAHHRRSLPKAPAYALRLCATHQRAWKLRDKHDIGAPPPRKKG
jgi:hypothetical protein